MRVLLEACFLGVVTTVLFPSGGNFSHRTVLVPVSIATKLHPLLKTVATASSNACRGVHTVAFPAG